MSKELGLAVLRPDYQGTRIPVMEHCGGLSRKAITHFTGIDPLAEQHRIPEAFRRLAEVLEVDLLWGGGLPTGGRAVFDWDDGESVKINPQGQRVVQWGIFHTTYQEDGRHFVHVPKPEAVEDALDFEPLRYFPNSVEEYRRESEAAYQEMLASVGDIPAGAAEQPRSLCYPIPHHYTTCFHGALAVFGFELLCLVGREDDERVAGLMARFAEVSLRITTAWSQVEGLKAFILHDDLTTAQGPIFSPAWYRRHIFPHYPVIFRPLREKGIPIIFTSDGNCTAFVDDIFSAGADGLNFEYLVDIEPLVARYPDKILIGNISSATIAQGPKEAIEREVRRCMEIGSRAPRFVVNVGGGLTHDMPVENLSCYLSLRRELARSPRAEPRASLRAR